MGLLYELRLEMKSLKAKIWFFSILAIMMFLFYSYIYGDILTTARVGISLWDEIFSGNIRIFYQDTFYLTNTAYDQWVWATYDFPIYIIFAAWNFPLWLIEHFGKIDIMNNVLCLMWIKTMLIPFVIVFLNTLYRVCILGEMNKRKALNTCIMVVTSGFLMSAIIMDGQYDIIEMCFIMLGIEAYLKNDMKKFCIYFTIAIPLKLFALLIFIPLLVLKEKRIIKIFVSVLIPFIVLAIFRFLIPTASDNLDENGEMIMHFPFEYTAHLGLDRIYVFIMCICIIVLVCWFTKIKNENMFQTVIYLCVIIYLIEFTTMMATPYWLIMIVPFLCIITMSSGTYILINSVLELLMTAGLVVAQIFHFDWCFDSNVASSMILPLIVGKKTISEPLSSISLMKKFVSSEVAYKIAEHIIGMGSSVFVGCAIIFVIINFPLFKKKMSVIEFNERGQEELYFFIRILAAAGIGIIPIMMYVLV